MLAAASYCYSENCNGYGGYGTVPFWGGLQTDSYSWLKVLHLIAAIATFGPVLLYPMLNRMARNMENTEARNKLINAVSTLNQRLFLPGLIATMLLGIMLVSDSGKAFKMSQAWISGAFAIVIALALVSWFGTRRSQVQLLTALSKGEDGQLELRRARFMAGTSNGITHLGLVAIILLMVWQPG